MNKELKKHKGGIPSDAIFVGRGTKSGNPFHIGANGDRATVIRKHADWFRDQHRLLRSLNELRGSNLVCFCAPLVVRI